MQIVVTQKLSWRLKELPAATGLTLAFWRKCVRLKKVRTRKVEGAVVILDSDLREFLQGKEEGHEAETSIADSTPTVPEPAEAEGRKLS
jgi:hypothetical protein